MSIEISKQNYSGSVQPMTIGSGKNAFTVGGETVFPFFTFEGEMPNQPRIAIQVLDHKPEDWAESCIEPYSDVLDDPVKWAKKAQDVYGADMIQLWLKSTDPNGMDRSADDAAAIAKAVSDAISVPLIVWGSNNPEKDAEVLRKVMEVCVGKDIIIGQVTEDNHKQLGAQALAYNATIIANSPIDINLAKQLNILLNNVGVPLNRIIIDPTTGGLGYGLEYSFSVMERIRQAAITQNDDKLQCPFICNLADEVWKTKEAKLPSDEMLGDAKVRGILMEAITATTLLNAGADILIMRHPEAIQQVREYIAELGGFEMPKEIKKVSTAAAATGKAAVSVSSNIADSLKEGSLCEIVQIMDMPIDLAPGHAIALIKTVESAEDASGLLLSTGVPVSAEESATMIEQEETTQTEKPVFTPEESWTPIEDITSGYEYDLKDFKDSSGQPVKLIQDSAEPGISKGKNDWRNIVDDRDSMIQHVKTDLHYWYSEGNGSEKRKTPA